jgi:hypothetical protein
MIGRSPLRDRVIDSINRLMLEPVFLDVVDSRDRASWSVENAAELGVFLGEEHCKVGYIPRNYSLHL